MKFLFPLLSIAAIFFFLYQKGIIFANFESVTAEQANAMLQKDSNNTVLIDVRTIGEYQGDGRIKGAVLFPLQTLGSDLAKLEKYKNKKLLVYCRSGSRSVSATRMLVGAGFSAVNMSGGINSWKASGYKVEK